MEIGTLIVTLFGVLPVIVIHIALARYQHSRDELFQRLAIEFGLTVVPTRDLKETVPDVGTSVRALSGRTVRGGVVIWDCCFAGIANAALPIWFVRNFVIPTDAFGARTIMLQENEGNIVTILRDDRSLASWGREDGIRSALSGATQASPK